MVSVTPDYSAELPLQPPLISQRILGQLLGTNPFCFSTVSRWVNLCYHENCFQAKFMACKYFSKSRTLKIKIGKIGEKNWDIFVGNRFLLNFIFWGEKRV